MFNQNRGTLADPAVDEMAPNYQPMSIQPISEGQATASSEYFSRPPSVISAAFSQAPVFFGNKSVSLGGPFEFAPVLFGNKSISLGGPFEFNAQHAELAERSNTMDFASHNHPVVSSRLSSACTSSTFVLKPLATSTGSNMVSDLSHLSSTSSLRFHPGNSGVGMDTTLSTENTSSKHFPDGSDHSG